MAVVADVATTPVLYHLHTDHLNRPIAMTDGAKQEVWRATYLPFGAVSSITGTASLDMRFPGQWFQLETGFHHNWHRTYDPTTGRYLQPDPLGMPDGPSRWAYARSAPTMYVDPTGQVVPFIVGAVVAVERATRVARAAYLAYELYQWASGDDNYCEGSLSSVGSAFAIVGELNSQPSDPYEYSRGRPIEFDGQFYSADGFRFSRSYYERLLTRGRPAPFLQARAVLESNPLISPDPEGAAGYYRYEGAGIEMIYNPTTGQVGHMRPLR